MGEPAKGTVTSLSSLFPADEAQKALQRVHDAISERRKQLEQLNDFIADNRNLVNLVQRLPDKLNHDVMVPFGKAAFFPGRLIHTNEFLVLLGEGYYADRSSKQTVDILTRRGKTLELQVKSLEAVMQDLKAEASFFDATAAESAEGLVEIREDLVEETSCGESATSGVSDTDSHNHPKEDSSQEVEIEDEEYARILSRMAELEKEEEEAEEANETSEDEPDETDFPLEKEEEEEEAEVANETSEDEPDETDFPRSIHQNTLDKKIGSSEVHDFSNLTKEARSSITNSNEGTLTASRNHIKKVRFQVEESNVRAPYEDDYSQGECLAFSQPRSTEFTPTLPGSNTTKVTKQNFDASKAFTGSIMERSLDIDLQPINQSIGRGSDTTKQSFDASKAFTGSIVERSPNIDLQPINQSVGRNSKPVPRLRIQKK